jgi:4-methylaminobutanoate oxidase (formaldehyde-forming)
MFSTARTDVLVIGAGALGASVAYHAAVAGMAVTVLDAHSIGDGTTSQSAGMVGQLRPRRAIGELISYSAALYARLENERPGVIGFSAVGSLRLATDDLRLREFEELAALARERGITCEILPASRLETLSPLLRREDVLGACWVPTDGQADPVHLARGLVALAEESGARVHTNAVVTEIDALSGGFRVSTASGTLVADRVVLAAGVHTTALAALVGVAVPLLASKQQAITSNPLPQSMPFPTLREPHRDLIMRASGDRLLVGSYAKTPEIVRGSEVPLQPRHQFEPEIERMMPAWEAAVQRVPVLGEIGWSHVVKAADAATADTELILGETALPGLWVASGGNGHGIAAAGGVGWFIAESLRTGSAPFSGSDFALDRFGTRLLSDADALIVATTVAEARHYALTEVES